jgi:hypothetical protein
MFISLLSFTRLEAKLAFNFIFKSLKKHVFCSLISILRVIISDQAAGMKALMPISLLSTILQFCNWYIIKNIKKRLADKGYSKEI